MDEGNIINKNTPENIFDKPAIISRGISIIIDTIPVHSEVPEELLDHFTNE